MKLYYRIPLSEQTVRRRSTERNYAHLLTTVGYQMRGSNHIVLLELALASGASPGDTATRYRGVR